MQKITAKMLILGAFLESIGSSFIWPINTIFIHDYLHKSLATAGMVLFFNSLATFCGSYAGGKLFDRIGGHKTAIISTSIALLALIGLIINHDWPAYPILLPILGFSVGSAFIVINSFASQIDNVDRYKLFNGIYVGTNLGNAIGTALGGYIASLQMTLVFVANFFFLSIFFLLAIFRYNDRTEKAPVTDKTIKKVKTRLQPGVSLLALFLGISWLAYSQWSSNISAHLTALGIPVSRYSLLWTINAIVIVVFLPLINRLIENRLWFKKIQIIIGVIFFMISFIAIINQTNFLFFVLGMIFLTIGEMLVYPGIPAIVSEATPSKEAGRYQSLLNMSSTFAKAVGPLVGGIIIERSSYNILYLVAIVILALSIIFFKRGKKELTI